MILESVLTFLRTLLNFLKPKTFKERMKAIALAVVILMVLVAFFQSGEGFLRLLFSTIFAFILYFIVSGFVKLDSRRFVERARR